MARNLVRIQFEIQHRPGRMHCNSDGLSRISCGLCLVCKKQEIKSKEANNGCSCNPADDNQEGSSPSHTESEQHDLGEESMGENNEAYHRVTTRSQTGSKTPWAQWLEAKSPIEIVSAQKADNISTVVQWLNDSTERPRWGNISHLGEESKHIGQIGTVSRYKMEFFIAAGSMK